MAPRWLHTRNQQWTLEPVTGLDDRTPPGLPEPGEDGGSPDDSDHSSGGTGGGGSDDGSGNIDDGSTGGGSSDGDNDTARSGASDAEPQTGCGCRLRSLRPSPWSPLLIASLLGLALGRRCYPNGRTRA